MKHILHIMILAILILASAPAWSFDQAAGKQLLEQNCNSCHGSELYTRKERLVTSRPGLTKQVKRCELALGLSWFDDDIDNVAEYLNQQFYRFGK